MQVNYEALIDETKNKMMKWQEINEQNMWELYQNKDGYIVYTKKNPENGITMNRTQTEIARTPDQILDLIGDVNKRPMYDEKVETAHVVEQIDANTRLVYVRMKAPIPFMSSRDLIMVQKVYKQNDGIIIVCAKSIIHQKTPPIPKIERAEMHLSGWIIIPQPNQMTKIIAIQCFDPRGDVPQSVTNQYAKLQSDMMKAAVKFIALNYK
ncbi:unnamed protein product [Paramecium primaurelia]|uniref:START domain-containing protein n=1 Tax=Paramecium primaurelia TaxID=5886 RepID=A0A8S1MYG4_PARPR|nr:unnamed protein product [Paramecium primaurelia]